MDDVINHIELGLKTHYSPDHHARIRRYILEDWKAAGVKLPTYSKLVARFITGNLPESWLVKLKYQTMDNMLKETVTPRYEFWACLHFYLLKKYGDTIILSNTQTAEIKRLGRALIEFGKIEAYRQETSFHLSDNKALMLYSSGEEGFQHIHMFTHHQNNEPFADSVTTSYIGALVRKNGKLTGVVRSISNHEPHSFEIRESELSPLDNEIVKEQLSQLGDAS